MIPVAPGDKVKTDKRDAKRLARLLRADELVAIRIPSPAEQAVRDLCRARAALAKDRRRARQRLVSFLLRHDVVYRAGSSWTQRHREWLDSRRFDDPALTATYQRYLTVATMRAADVAAVEDELEAWFVALILADTVARLSAYRGIDRLGALHVAAEVCDWRRFANAPQFMSFPGSLRAFQWRSGVARSAHPGRQRARPHPTGRVGVGVSASTAPQSCVA
jgi:transposase